MYSRCGQHLEHEIEMIIYRHDHLIAIVLQL